MPQDQKTSSHLLPKEDSIRAMGPLTMVQSKVVGKSAATEKGAKEDDVEDY
jgi:hypothetical protein